MDISLAGRTAWVTGGSEGIGRAIARQLAECGARVALTARDAADLEDAVGELERSGAEAMAAAADVSSPDEMKRAVQQIVDRWGGLDTVVANAGTNGTWAPIDELTPDEWSQTIAVNLTGSFLTIHAAVPHLKKSDGASVTLISSVNGTRVFSNEGASAYASSKAGQLALGKMAALELAQFKIRVNVVCPGAFDTGIHEKTDKQDLDKIDTPIEFPEGSVPLTQGDMGDPSQIGKLVAFLSSDAAGHITGTPVWIDGAESLLQG
ncbi:SDR family NAD(P)-dependent oxidoreductase [Botrimarina sp.]|uniref:SDR family oxidoreductase n=1 Tax=Botrimarina sp. TaxID=2795802 RepID=UPI0032EFCAA7